MANEHQRIQLAFRAAGFQIENTSGGCECYRRDHSGLVTVVTAEDDPILPTTYAEPVVVSTYTQQNWEETGGNAPISQETMTVYSALAAKEH